MDNMDNKNPKKIPEKSLKFFCEKCDYSTGSKKDFDKHLATQKHKKREMITNDNKLSKMDNIKVVKKLLCLCGKEYKYIQGLYKHKKSCNYTDTICVEIQKPKEESGEVVALLMEQNKILM